MCCLINKEVRFSPQNMATVNNNGLSHLWPGRCSVPLPPHWLCRRCTRRSPLGSELWRGSWCQGFGDWAVRRSEDESPASTRIEGGEPGWPAVSCRWGWTLGWGPDERLWTPARQSGGLKHKQETPGCSGGNKIIFKFPQGVPQGWVLGPLRFGLNMLLQCEINGYADDTLLYLSIKPGETKQLLWLQPCFRDIKTWMTCNFLAFQLRQDGHCSFLSWAS